MHAIFSIYPSHFSHQSCIGMVHRSVAVASFRPMCNEHSDDGVDDAAPLLKFEQSMSAVHARDATSTAPADVCVIKTKIQAQISPSDGPNTTLTR